MNVAISINGIFRDLLGKIKEVHQKYYESEIDGELTDKNVKKKLGFKTTKQYLKFLYEEAPMETFGHAKESENNSFIHLNNFLMENKHLNVTLMSDEVGRGIPATLWFLAKYGSQVKNIRFITKDDKPNVWNDFDVIVTNDSDIIKNKPKEKVLITVNCRGNSTFKVKKIREVFELSIFKSNE